MNTSHDHGIDNPFELLMSTAISAWKQARIKVADEVSGATKSTQAVIHYVGSLHGQTVWVSGSAQCTSHRPDRTFDNEPVKIIECEYFDIALYSRDSLIVEDGAGMRWTLKLSESQISETAPKRRTYPHHVGDFSLPK
jgi:hypothetical protein